MKATIDIPDALYRKAERVAAERGVTLRELVEDGLRAVLEGPDPRTAHEPFRLHVHSGSGLQPGVSWSRLSDAIDATYEGRGT